ncbi:MAG: Ig-like domain-containing protein [Candidatus Thiodiazotropha sp. 'RUGA']|nr:Ig-like domain-containing protein [Candidatus Thiodiazotropha sp. 'RUGA']
MMVPLRYLGATLIGLLLSLSLQAADVVPNEVTMPGTQPNEVGNFESPGRCDNCHGGYDNLQPENEPSTGWAGAAMGNAGRDPIFWATLAIAEQDFDGSGDLCIRCHSAGGWYGGRSTPTDGSGLQASDDNGIDCDTCHTMTNPDDSEHLGVMNSPFIANCNPDPLVPNKCSTTGAPGEGFYGSGITSLWGGSDKLGPYADAEARHQFMQSSFHRSVDFCGTCHDVSNPVVGDLAPGSGAQPGNPHSVVASGTLGGPIEDKAAFNNPPYAYGIVERTFSEYKASAFPTTLVSDFDTLPTDLQVQGGSIKTTYDAALIAGTGGNYEDGTPRFFSCQSCHMRPVEAAGCNKKGAPVRRDMPMHDQTGGNYWFANMTQYQDANNTLRLGGGLTGNQILALDLGQARAVKHLEQAADLQVNGNILKVVNLTGHKLISGYPEGRRMWLNMRWYDSNGNLLREDGEYGSLGITVNDENGSPVDVESIIDLNDPNTRIYEAHYAVTKEWATTLQALHGPDFVLSYDRLTGLPDCTVSEFLADAFPECSGPYHETFHFVLNNHVSKDNRIPPYGMRFDEAQKRNALPNPPEQYGDPTNGGNNGIYNYWDEVTLNPPTGAVYGEISLLYQGTSWEYIQFLDKANNGTNAFLGQEGSNMLAAWVNADVPVAMTVGGDKKMVPPVVMKTIEWGTPPTGNNAPTCSIDTPAGDVIINEGESINYSGSATDSDGTIASYAWSFPGGTPTSSNVANAGSVSYAVAGIYATTFTATDNGGASCTPATVQVTVNTVGGNNPPIAADDSYSTAQDTVLNLVAPGVLSNDSDPDGDPITAILNTNAGNGLVLLNADGSFTYTPNTGFTGVDSFTYLANDGAADSNLATVTVDVTAVLNCGTHTDRNSCRAQAGCRWVNKNNLCIAR